MSHGAHTIEGHVQTETINIGSRLTETARNRPHAIGIAEPIKGTDRNDARRYRTVTFAQLDRDSSNLAARMRELGVVQGTRLVLMVMPGIDFIALTFAILKAGAVAILIDPGMGRKNLLSCLEDVQPEGFVALPIVHAIRSIFRARFSRSWFHVTVGRRWFWGGCTLDQLRKQDAAPEFLAETRSKDPAAIIFTSGSTGPPKGVLYRHGNFWHQVDQLQRAYDIQPGEVDLPGFPLFGLFNCAMGVTTVIPDMDPTRPAQVDSRKIVGAIRQWSVTQAFGSPAMWNAVGRYCEDNQETMPSVCRVLSAGAPVPSHVLKQMRNAISPDGEIHTPYGATEALPVATNHSRELLNETTHDTSRGAGTCVGKRFGGIDWRVIRINDGPLKSIQETVALARGEIGELIVRGPVVTTEYVTRIDENAIAKIVDGDGFWHRMGDVGYIDDQDRFWFCGRKAHRVITSTETLYPVQCEAVFNNHAHIYRSALVGVGEMEKKLPVLVAEPWPQYFPTDYQAVGVLCDELFELGQKNKLTQSIQRKNIHLRKSLPVDIRHNAKIVREQVAEWAAKTTNRGLER